MILNITRHLQARIRYGTENLSLIALTQLVAQPECTHEDQRNPFGILVRITARPGQRTTKAKEKSPKIHHNGGTIMELHPSVSAHKFAPGEAVKLVEQRCSSK